MKYAVDERIDSHGRARVTRSSHVVCGGTRSRQGRLPLPPLLA